MAAHDRIRLIGLLTESPAVRGFPIRGGKIGVADRGGPRGAARPPAGSCAGMNTTTVPHLPARRRAARRAASSAASSSRPTPTTTTPAPAGTARSTAARPRSPTRSDADDVAAAIRAARAAGLPFTIRAGGHSVSGRSVRDGALCIDLRALNERRGRPRARRSSASAAARCSGELDAATQEHGLAVPAGQISHTGVGGLTLGGGIGWLMRHHGLTIDSLRGCRGRARRRPQIVRASADEHADLFWALRGGGGDFGAVTAFEFRAQPRRADRPRRHARLPVGAGAARRSARRRALMARRAGRADDRSRRWSPRRRRRRSRPSCRAGRSRVVAVAWCGDLAEGERVLAPLRAGCPPALDLVGPMPYVALQSMLDETAPHGWRFYDTLHYLPEVERRVHRRRCSPASRRAPTPQAHVMTALDGRRDRPRRARRDGVRPPRRARAHVDHRLLGRRADRARGRVGAATSGRRRAPFASGGVYVNALDAGRPVRDAYADDVWERLVDGQAPLRPRRRLRSGNGDRAEARAPRARRARPPRRGCARRAWPSTRPTWCSAVFGAITSRSAISAFERPAAIRPSTSRSRAVSSSRSPRDRVRPATPSSRSSARRLVGVARARRGARRRRAPRAPTRARAASPPRPGRARARAARAPPRAGSPSAAKPATASSSAARGRRSSPRASGGAAREQRRLGREVLAREALRPRSPQRRSAARRGGVEVAARASATSPREHEQRPRRPPARGRARAARARQRADRRAARCSCTSAARAPPARPRARRAGARPPRSGPAAAAGRRARRAAATRPPPRRAVRLALERLASSTASARAQSPERTSTRAEDRAAPRLHRHEAAALGELDDRLAPLRGALRGRRGRRRRRASCSTRRRTPAGRSSRRRARRSSPRRAAPRPSSTRPWRDERRGRAGRAPCTRRRGRRARGRRERRAGVPLGLGRVAGPLGLLDREPAELGDRCPRRASSRRARASQPAALGVAAVDAVLAGEVGREPRRRRARRRGGW